MQRSFWRGYEHKKISKVENFAVFKNFEWDISVCKDGTTVSLQFKHINIIYGRNYSGKTSLLRIARAIETGGISDKIANPVFCVDFEDGTQITQSNFLTASNQIRVFNEDFVSNHLHFIRNPEEGVASFAILGADNFAIETEISRLESELGCNEEGNESGLYASLKTANLNFNTSKNAHDKAFNRIPSQGHATRPLIQLVSGSVFFS